MCEVKTIFLIEAKEGARFSKVSVFLSYFATPLDLHNQQRRFLILIGFYNQQRKSFYQIDSHNP